MSEIFWTNARKKISELVPWDKNPRKISDEQLAHLKRSIEKFGYAAPVLVDSDGRIVAGHMRTKAMMALGMGEIEVDVRVASRKLTDDEFRELAIRDNANGGEWDIDKMLDIDLDFLKNLGLEDNLLNKIARTNRIDDAENAPDPPLEAKTRTLQLYKLGDHRLMCGNSTDRENVMRLMESELADMVFVDPPYNINYSGLGKNTSNTIQGDNQTEEKFRVFLTAAFDLLFAFTKEKAPLYTCYASRTHREFEDSLNKCSWEVRSQIIWVKTLASMGWGDYRWKHEPIFYCHKEGQAIDFYGDRKNYTEWIENLDDEALLKKIKSIIEKDETEGQTTVWRVKREVNYKHPTQKPVQLVKIAIANSSRPGEIVLDTFGGSGSTLMAAEMIGRRAYVMELEPKYCDVIIERWEKFTGNKAQLI